MRRLLTFVVVAVAAVVTALPLGAAAQSDAEPVERVLVLSLPTLSWADLRDADVPNLDALAEQSAVANLSVRAVNRVTDAGDGYGTMGAGTRVRGMPGVDTLGFEVEESYGLHPAAETFQSRTGRRPDAGIVHLGQPALERRNADLPYDAEIGALGDALRTAGVGRSVIANADQRIAGTTVYGRTASLAVTDGDGAVPGGRVAGDLLVGDPDAPFGTWLDEDAVLAAFTEAWRDRSVVVVEASDLVRADAAQPLATPEQATALRRRALERTDRLVGRLLAEVDPERHAVLAVGPYHARSGPHLTVAALRAPGLEPGFLRSASTRRSGYVSLVDVAPTVLDLLAVDRPASMEGRAFEAGDAGDTAAGRRDDLVEGDRAARFRDDLINPFWTAFIVLNVVLCGAAIVAIRRGRSWSGLRLAALSLLGVLPATYLAGLFAFHRIGALAFWVFVGVAGAGIGAAALLLGRRRPVDPLLAVLAVVLGLLLVDVVVGAPLQLNTVAGYSPTVAGRFAGFGNLAFAQLAAAGVLLAALLAHRIGGRRGALVGIALLAGIVVADGAPMWGSDVGGVLALVPTLGVLTARLLGWRFRPRLLAVTALATVAVLTLFALVDLSRPPDRRTHLGRLVEQVRDGGFDAFETVVLRKLGANLSVLTSSVFTFMVPIFLLFVGYLLWRSPEPVRRIKRDVPELGAALAAFGVAAVLGFALNDSGISVPAVMFGVGNTSLVYLIARQGAAGGDGDRPFPDGRAAGAAVRRREPIRT